jgi:branched-chain amino acid transport system permease protein
LALLLQEIANGLMIGGTYALIAIGFTLVFGVARILNLAHPEIFMIGAYTGMLALRALPGNLPFAILAAIVVCGLVGVIVELLVLRPVRGGSFFAPLITSIGASIVLQNIVIRILGSESQPFAVGLPSGTVQVGGIVLTTVQLWLFFLSVILMVAVRFIVDRTSYGRSIRATAEDPTVA